MFHLCEYSPERIGRADAVVHNDITLLEMLIGQLAPEGRILFYTGSEAWRVAAEAILAKAVETGQLSKLMNTRGSTFTIVRFLRQSFR